MGLWLQLGVSGSCARLSAGVHDFLRWRTGDAILLAEANILPAENLKYFGPEGDRMHMILNFQVNQTMFYAFGSAWGHCST